MKTSTYHKLSLLLASSGISLVLMEQAYRFYLFGWDSFSVEKVNSVNAIGVSGLLQKSAHPEILFELKPNLDTYFKLVPFVTNSRGLRDREYELRKPAGVFRVAVIGDSFTLPAGVAIEDSFHSILEDRLNDEEESGSYQFINFAVGGYYLTQYLGVIKHKAIQYDPDLILIGFCAGNDFQVLHPMKMFPHFRIKERTYPFFSSFALNTFALALEGEVENRKRSKRQDRYVRQTFRELAAIGQAKGLRIVIAYLSNQPEDYRPIERIVKASGIEYFIDVSSSFRNTELSDYRIYPIDNHPNAKAHKIFADRICDYLARNNLLRRGE